MYTEEELTKFKEWQAKANEFFSKNKENWIICKALSAIVKVKPEFMEHLRFRDNKHKRSEKEVYVRYSCLPYIKKILEEMAYYQEYESREISVKERKNGDDIFVKKMSEYFVFTAVMKYNDAKRKIRVVIRKIFWADWAELVTVMPKRHKDWIYDNIIDSLIVDNNEVELMIKQQKNLTE